MIVENNPCSICGARGIPGLIIGAGKCQAHWNLGAFGTPLEETWNRPCASAPLVSYRARSPYGWIMIGSRDDADAMREAKRSTDNPTNLQRWDGTAYVNV